MRLKCTLHVQYILIFPATNLNIIKQLSLPASDVWQLIPLLQGQILRNYKTQWKIETMQSLNLICTKVSSLFPSALFASCITEKGDDHRESNRITKDEWKQKQALNPIYDLQVLKEFTAEGESQLENSSTYNEMTQVLLLLLLHWLLLLVLLKQPISGPCMFVLINKRKRGGEGS